MTDIEWIAAVRAYALQFGCYRFSEAERRRMLPYVRGDFFKLLHSNCFLGHMHCNIVMTYDLMAEMERGMVDAVTGTLTR